MNMIENLDLLPNLIKIFQNHKGYWEISQHEDWNIEIQWYPFIKEPLTSKGISIKRCIDIQDYINKITQEFKNHNITL